MTSSRPTRNSGPRSLWLSLLVITHGRDHQLVQCLESVASALGTIVVGGEVEVVVSSDTPNQEAEERTERAVRTFSSRHRDLHIRFLASTSPHGQSANTNRALAAAKGEYIHILHDDDRLCHGYYDLIFGYLRTQSPSLVILKSEPNTDLVASEFRQAFKGDPGRWIDPKVMARSLLPVGTIVPSCLIMRRQLALETGGFDESLDFVCDWKFFCELILETIRCGEFILELLEPVVQYRSIAESVSSTAQGTATHFVENLVLQRWMARESCLFVALALEEDEILLSRRRARIYRHRRLAKEVWYYPDSQGYSREVLLQFKVSMRRQLKLNPDHFTHPLPSTLAGYMEILALLGLRALPVDGPWVAARAREGIRRLRAAKMRCVPPSFSVRPRARRSQLSS